MFSGITTNTRLFCTSKVSWAFAQRKLLFMIQNYADQIKLIQHSSRAVELQSVVACMQSDFLSRKAANNSSQSDQ